MSELIDEYAEALGALTDVDFAVAMHIADGAHSRAAILYLAPMKEYELGESLRRLHRAGMLFGDSPPPVIQPPTRTYHRPQICLSIAGYRWVAPARAARRA